MKTVLNRYGAIVLLGVAVILVGVIDQTTKDALKVRHILRTIDRQASRTDSNDLTAEVTQKELNAYIAYRLAQDQRSFIDSLEVDLLGGNHVRGRLSVDPQRLNLDGLLGTELDFVFKGIFLTRDGAARLDLISLHLNDQPVKPQVLDFVIATAAMVYGTESGGIDDWYELPGGIKRIVVNKAVAVLYY